MQELAHPNSLDLTSGFSNAALKYSGFIDNTLVPKLKNSCELRDKVYNSISEYLKLKSLIETFTQNSLDEYKALIDLGSNFYVQGKSSSTEFLYVNVGFGFHLKMTKAEAIVFIDKKQIHLEKLANNYTEEINQLRAKIKLMREAIAEIAGMTDNQE
ncbi:hypothetical protein BB561_002898 [Smittium simulii]|uniref:Prefoldin, alpha subunit n=1 Tax=Smittium simulii TaxID=133385 RepID=A0A2T9YNR4_9FUNG|nr:hypothetical protein BB561_002898 [Smittium simulii]